MDLPRSGVRGPSQRKRRAILEAAFRVFLKAGFGGATIEEVADAADVSKQTVYAHFGGGDEGAKETLFRAMVEQEVGRLDQPDPVAAALGVTVDLAGDLTTFARHHLRLVMTPDLVRLRRMLIGEAERFPALAAAWYANGPAQSSESFAAAFAVLHRRGLLDIDDPLVAGQTFNWLVLSTPLNHAMAHPDVMWSGDDLDRVADEAVRVFLAAFGPDRGRSQDSCGVR